MLETAEKWNKLFEYDRVVSITTFWLLFSAFSWSFRDEKQKIWSFLWKKLRKDKDYAKNFVILHPILVVMSSRYWRMNSVIAHNAIDSPRRAEGKVPDMALWLKRATSGSSKAKPHEVGMRVTTLCRKGVYSTLHRYTPNFEHLESL